MTDATPDDTGPDTPAPATPAAAATETLLNTVADVNCLVSLPVDVDAALAGMGLESGLMPLDAHICGLLVKDRPGGRFKALAAIGCNHHRRRFVLAHELGHYVHMYQDLPKDSLAGRIERTTRVTELTREPEEIWANHYAEALLMPASVIRSHWGDGDDPREMAELLDVSMEAMMHRLLTLHFI